MYLHSLYTGATAYVLTESPGGVGYWLWNPHSGEHYSQHEPYTPLTSVGCAINEENVRLKKIILWHRDRLVPGCPDLLNCTLKRSGHLGTRLVLSLSPLGVGQHSRVRWSQPSSIWFLQQQTVEASLLPRPSPAPGLCSTRAPLLRDWLGKSSRTARQVDSQLHSYYFIYNKHCYYFVHGDLLIFSIFLGLSVQFVSTSWHWGVDLWQGGTATARESCSSCCPD